MPHISAHQSRLSVLSVPVSDAYQCQSVPHISVLFISATYQCQSVPPISAIHECCFSSVMSVNAHK
ncbi:unnamed protein product [Staurois parvus]|uniref:Uncharacterized protein n=1 Tax=Staurois parvus TaxID=386267 RepID=A0ABN9EPX6_9NEOB|nr:unnamed protein product [Staurois parvus]